MRISSDLNSEFNDTNEAHHYTSQAAPKESELRQGDQPDKENDHEREHYPNFWFEDDDKALHVRISSPYVRETFEGVRL